MKSFLVSAAIIAVAYAAGAENFTPGLRVKFDMVEGLGETFMYDIPRYVTDAKTQGWRRYKRPVGPLPQLVLYCLPDKVFCTLYDDTGYIAGLQIAINPAEVEDATFDWETRGFTKWHTSIDNKCEVLYAIQQYYVDEEFLSKSMEERLASRDPKRTLQAGAVWVTGTDKELLKVSTDEEDIKQSIFTEQACLTAMGNHYYYNMTDSTECVSEQMYAWFPMANDGELIATGFMTFGTLPIKEGQRDWFERPNAATVNAIVPYGPECLLQTVSDAGAITMHIYYVDDPWNISC